VSRRPCRSCVVDEDVEAAKFARHGIGERAHLGKRCEVSSKEARFAAALRDPLDAGVAPRFVPPMDDHVRAFRGEPLGDDPADPVRRAGHKDGLTVHCTHKTIARSRLLPSDVP
jgi:hypothetical protein